MSKVLKTVARANRRSVILNIKLNQAENEYLDAMALEYTEGNKSEYARYALMNFKPRGKDLVESPLPNQPLPLQVQRSI